MGQRRQCIGASEVQVLLGTARVKARTGNNAGARPVGCGGAVGEVEGGGHGCTWLGTAVVVC